MIGCIYRGYGMAGLLSYLGGKDEAMLLATNLFGAAPRDFLRQIDDVGRLRAKAPAAPVVHLTLRAAGGEDLSDQQWSSAVDYVLQELGYDDSPFMAYLHTHEGGRHLHIATYRVRFDGGLVSDSMDRYRIMAVCRELERRFSLTIATPQRSRRLTRPALEKAVQQPDREVRLAAVRRAISEAAAESFTLRELVTRLYSMGITTHLKVARNTGKLQGVSFELPVSREIIRGSTLGKQFSLANLCNAHNLAVDHAASGPVLVMHGLTNLELRRLRQSLPPDRVVSEGSRQNAYWVLPVAASDFADLVVTRMPHRFVTFAGLDPYLHPTQELLESRQQLALTVRRQLEHPSPAASIADGAPALESMLASLDRIRLESSRPEFGPASRAAALGRLAHAVSGELSSPRISEGERAAALVAYHEIVPAAAPAGPLEMFYPQTYAERADRLSLALLREHHSGWSQALLRASSPAQRQALDHVATQLGELCSLAQLSLPLAAVRERLELVQAALRELPSDQLKDSLALVAERRAYQDLLSDHSRHRQPPPASSDLSPARLPAPLIHRLVEDVAKDRADAVTLGGDSPAYAFALAALRELLPESPRHPYVSRASVERLCQSIDYLTEETSTKQFAVALLHHLLERHDEAAAAGPPGYEAPDAISLTLVELHLEAHRRRRDAAPDLAAFEASSSSYSALLPLQTDHPLGVPLSAVEAHLEELSRTVEKAGESTRPAAVAARRAVLDLLDDHRRQQAPSSLSPSDPTEWVSVSAVKAARDRLMRDRADAQDLGLDASRFELSLALVESLLPEQPWVTQVPAGRVRRLIDSCERSNTETELPLFVLGELLAPMARPPFFEAPVHVSRAVFGECANEWLAHARAAPETLRASAEAIAASVSALTPEGLSASYDSLRRDLKALRDQDLSSLSGEDRFAAVLRRRALEEALEAHRRLLPPLPEASNLFIPAARLQFLLESLLRDRDEARSLQNPTDSLDLSIEVVRLIAPREHETHVHCGVLERYIALLHDLPAYSQARELLIATVRAHQANPDLPAFTEPAHHISCLLLEEHLRRWETLAAPHRDAAQDALRRVGASSGSVLVARQTVQVHLDSVTELLEQSPPNGALLAQRRALQDLLDEHSFHRPSSSDATLPAAVVVAFALQLDRASSDATALGLDAAPFVEARHLLALLTDNFQSPLPVAVLERALAASHDAPESSPALARALEELLARATPSASIEPPAGVSYALWVETLRSLEADPATASAASHLERLHAPSSDLPELVIPTLRLEALYAQLGSQLKPGASDPSGLLAARRALCDLLEAANASVSLAPPAASVAWLPIQVLEDALEALRRNPDAPFRDARLACLEALCPGHGASRVHPAAVERLLASVELARLAPPAADVLRSDLLSLQAARTPSDQAYEAPAAVSGLLIATHIHRWQAFLDATPDTELQLRLALAAAVLALRKVEPHGPALATPLSVLHHRAQILYQDEPDEPELAPAREFARRAVHELLHDHRSLQAPLTPAEQRVSPHAIARLRRDLQRERLDALDRGDLDPAFDASLRVLEILQGGTSATAVPVGVVRRYLDATDAPGATEADRRARDFAREALLRLLEEHSRPQAQDSNEVPGFISLALFHEHRQAWLARIESAADPLQRARARASEKAVLALFPGRGQLAQETSAVVKRSSELDRRIATTADADARHLLIAACRALDALLEEHRDRRCNPRQSHLGSGASLPASVFERHRARLLAERSDAMDRGDFDPAAHAALRILPVLLSSESDSVPVALVERYREAAALKATHADDVRARGHALSLLDQILSEYRTPPPPSPAFHEAPERVSASLLVEQTSLWKGRAEATTSFAERQACRAAVAQFQELLPSQKPGALSVTRREIRFHIERLGDALGASTDPLERAALVAARRALRDTLTAHQQHLAPVDTLSPHAGPDWIPAAFFHHHQAALRAELPFAANPAPTEAALLALRDLTPASTDAGVHVEVVRRHLASVAVLEPSAPATYSAVRNALEAVIADHARQASPRLDPRDFDPATVANAYQISRALLDQHLRDAEAQLERSPEAAAYLLTARLSALRELAAIERPTLPVEAVYASLARHDRAFSLATDPLHRSFHLQARSALVSLLQDHSRLTIPRPLDRAPSSFHDPGDQIPSALLRSHLQGYSAQITAHSSLERPTDRRLVHQARLRLEALTPLLPATPEGTVSATLLREQRSLLLETARHDPDRASDLRGQSDALAAVLYDHQRSYRNDAGARLEASSRALREAEAAYFADPRAETYALWCAHLHHHQNDLTDFGRIENDRRLSGRRTYFAREVRALARHYERRLLLNFTPDYLQLRAEAWLRNKASQFALRPVYRGLSMLPGGSALSSGLSVASQTAQLSYRTYLELRLLRDALRPGALENGNLSTRALLKALRHARLAPAAALPTRPATSLGSAIGGCRTADLALARGVRAFRRDQLDRPRLLALAQNALSARAELTQFTLSQLGVPRLEQLETLLGSRSKALGTWLGSLWEAGLSARSVTQVFIQVAPVVFADKALSLSFVAARALVRHAFSSSMTSAQEALILREQHEQRR